MTALRKESGSEILRGPDDDRPTRDRAWRPPGARPTATKGTPSASSATATTVGRISRRKSSTRTTPTSARPTCTARRRARGAARPARTSGAGSRWCRGLEKPPEGMSWQEYAFRRATDANPFPSQMGRVCPAPCEDGCNRNEVEDFVGINAVEQFIGDTAVAEGFAFEPPAHETGKRIAIIGGGPAGMTAAYQLRRRGHRCTIYGRPRGARRDDALRHPGVPHPAAAPRPRNRSHPRPRRDRDPVLDPGRSRRERRAGRGRARRGPVDDRMPERGAPFRCRAATRRTA